MDHRRPINADETDIVAVGAMHAVDMRQPSPACAPIGRHLVIGTAIEPRRIHDDAAGIVAGQSRTRTKHDIAGQRRAAGAPKRSSKRRDKDELLTQCLPPSTAESVRPI